MRGARQISLDRTSTLSSDSMVEIKHDPETSASGAAAAVDVQDDAKYRLIYAKSKVYVNPTAYARDNIPGFAAIVKREAFTTSYLLAWIPENLLSEKGPDEWDKFIRTEERPLAEDDEDEDAVLIDMPTSLPESYAFSVPLSSVYSLIVLPPSLSSWCEYLSLCLPLCKNEVSTIDSWFEDGSIGINLTSGATLPTLHFHDDESRSFTLPPKSPSTPSVSTSYPPPPSYAAQASTGRPITSWGGEDLLARVRSYASLLRSSLQSTLFLVDPSKADIEAHTTHLFSDDAVDEILARSSYANSHSPVPEHRRPRPLSSPQASTPNPYSQHSSILHRSLPPSSASLPPASQARTALLQSFANITRATRHAAQNILSHPLAKPIIPHLPDPVRSLVNVNGDLEWGSWVEKGGVGEFESARVYLARWARIVAEEGERARRREAQAIPASISSVAEEASELGIFELLQSTANLPTPKSSRDPKHPVDEESWHGWFGEDGRPNISMEQLRQEVFRRGICEKGTVRRQIWPFLLGVHAWDATTEERQRGWEEKMKQYHDIQDEWFGNSEVFDRQDVLEERHRIDVDCRRTDRSHPLFSISPSSPSLSNSDPEKQQHRRYSTIAPSMNDIGAQSPSNEHIDRLAGILLTYNFYEKELGHLPCQSMQKQNFLRDQSGMKKQLSTLQQLIEVMDPELFRHLEKTDGLNLFFCFRWVLITFKREFPFDDVLRLWEVLWTDYYSNDFVLFVALAVLESHREVIIRYLVEYCNELSMTIELDTTLAQAEVLFLSFAQLVADMDRRRVEASSGSGSEGLRRRAVSHSAAAAAKLAIPELSQDLRDLLKAGRT
ncbi:hypothetical protein EW146_g6779 [Bondarzewia mesenterica]|uniref:Rab-GAP TBC domain-containing protein n=1 Tax=Bondarzewia mesenterica TaxID=1095465 RepID=A0A4S4LPI9_9AGAM|nr:hypothetical protein EW146_g6779 [Bondarzewia mesenterica]